MTVTIIEIVAALVLAYLAVNLIWLLIIALIMFSRGE